MPQPKWRPAPFPWSQPSGEEERLLVLDEMLAFLEPGLLAPFLSDEEQLQFGSACRMATRAIGGFWA